MIMIQDRIDIWNTGEYNYPAAFGFIPNLMSYLHDEDETVRPALLIIPGGGYEFVSAREGELVALEFYDRGYNCFVLTYTVDLLCAVPLRMQALEDASRAMRLIRTIAPSYYIDPNRITVLGFSAGGHLAASLCVHHKDSIEIDPRLADASARPDAAILCYPVISFGAEWGHAGSGKRLLGEERYEAEQEKFCLSGLVTGETPPTFLCAGRAADIYLAYDGRPVCACREFVALYERTQKKRGTPVDPHFFKWTPRALTGQQGVGRLPSERKFYIRAGKQIYPYGT